MPFKQLDMSRHQHVFKIADHACELCSTFSGSSLRPCILLAVLFSWLLEDFLPGGVWGWILMSHLTRKHDVLILLILVHLQVDVQTKSTEVTTCKVACPTADTRHRWYCQSLARLCLILRGLAELLRAGADVIRTC